VRHRDAGGDLNDGIIAPPYEDVSEKYMPPNVIFEKDAAPAATIDLDREQNIAAVRVHAGQEPGFHLAFPAAIGSQAIDRWRSSRAESAPVDRVLRNAMGKRIAAPPPIFTHRLRRSRSTRAVCFSTIYPKTSSPNNQTRAASSGSQVTGKKSA